MRISLKILLPSLFVAALGLLAGAAPGSPLLRAKMGALAGERYGAEGRQLVAEWWRALDLAQGQPIEVQLARINQYFNVRTTFQSDQESWDQPDYWATPLETLTHHRGDCEDFAIAKYFSLLTLGVPQSRLRMIYVRALLDGRSQAHMVLGYYATPDAEPVILDNLRSEIEPASQRSDLTPVFSFNGEGLWAGNVRAPGDPSVRLSRWRDLLSRLREEGFQ